MTNWILRIDLKDLWNKFPELSEYNQVDFIPIRDMLVKELKLYSEKIKKIPSLGRWVKMEYDNLIDALSITKNLQEFNSCFDMLYDWADTYKVWIATNF